MSLSQPFRSLGSNMPMCSAEKPDSMYHFEGFYFEYELKDVTIKATIQKRDSESSPNDDLKQVIDKRLVRLFQTAKFYASFAELDGTFSGSITADIGWSNRRFLKMVISRFVNARKAYLADENALPIPGGTPYLNRILCGLVDDFIATRNSTRRMNTDDRAAYIDRVRTVWKQAIQKDFQAVIDAPPSIPDPGPDPDWLQWTGHAPTYGVTTRTEHRTPSVTYPYGSNRHTTQSSAGYQLDISQVAPPQSGPAQPFFAHLPSGQTLVIKPDATQPAAAQSAVNRANAANFAAAQLAPSHPTDTIPSIESLDNDNDEFLQPADIEVSAAAGSTGTDADGDECRKGCVNGCWGRCSLFVTPEPGEEVLHEQYRPASPDADGSIGADSTPFPSDLVIRPDNLHAEATPVPEPKTVSRRPVTLSGFVVDSDDESDPTPTVTTTGANGLSEQSVAPANPLVAKSLDNMGLAFDGLDPVDVHLSIVQAPIAPEPDTQAKPAKAEKTELEPALVKALVRHSTSQAADLQLLLDSPRITHQARKHLSRMQRLVELLKEMSEESVDLV